jgi:oligopeptide/dipeptide ABC transporter ATP-binding protein
VRTSPILEVENLTVEITSGRHRMRPVEDVSFAVAEGEALGIVGESGCGKSTLLLAVLGVLPPEAAVVAGSIVVDGRDLLRLSDRERRQVRGAVVGMVFQDPGSVLNPVARVGRQIVDGAAQHLGLDRREAKALARQMLVEVGVPDPDRRVDAYPHELSGGLRQRVMIAMALASKPSILLCDEPTTALDVTIQNQVLNVISRAQRSERLALVYVTHDLAVVRQTCDHVAVMYAARMIETGTCDDVLRSPRHPYTRALLAAVPDLDVDDRVLDPIAGAPPDLWAALDGCRFRPRCGIRRSECASGTFPLLGDRSHRSACRPIEDGAEGVPVALSATARGAGHG